MRYVSVATAFALSSALWTQPAAAELRGEVIHGANCEASRDFSSGVGGLATSQGLYVWGPADVTCGLTMGSHSFTGGSIRWDARDLRLVFLQVAKFGGSGGLHARLLFQEFLSGTNYWGPESVAAGSASLMLSPPSVMPSAPWHASVVISVDGGSVFAVRDVNPLWWR